VEIFKTKFRKTGFKMQEERNTNKLLSKAPNVPVGKAQAEPKAERTRQYVSILTRIATLHTGTLGAFESNLKELELIAVGIYDYLGIIGNDDIILNPRGGSATTDHFADLTFNALPESALAFRIK
jgi:hypothetical protein